MFVSAFTLMFLGYAIIHDYMIRSILKSLHKLKLSVIVTLIHKMKLFGQEEGDDIKSNIPSNNDSAPFEN